MARVPYVQRDDLTALHQTIYHRIGAARGGEVPAVFQLLLNAPELGGRVAEIGAYSRNDTIVPPPVRETVILATSRKLHAQYEFTHHLPMAQRAGVRDGVIEGIKSRTTKGMKPDEAAYVDYAGQVVDQTVTDASFKGIEKLLGRQGAVELTVIISYYAMLSHAMQALGVDLEPDRKPLMPEP